MSNYYLNIAIRVCFFVITVFMHVSIFADYKSPTVKANENQKTNFFDNKINDRGSFDSMLEDQKNRYGVSQNHTSGLNGIVDIDGHEASAQRGALESIDGASLESEGHRRYGSQEGNELLEMHKDFNDPLMQQEKRDIEKLSSDSAKSLSGLMSGLRDLGVECNESGEDVDISPIYSVEKEDQHHRNVIYDKAICQDLRNKYNCHDSLSLTCISQTRKSLRLNVTSNNINILKNEAGHFEAGWTNPVGHVGDRGKVFDYFIRFRINDKADIESFILEKINYDDFVLVKLNDYHIFSGPFGGNKLELHPAPNNANLRFDLVSIDNTGRLYSAENNTWFFRALNMSLLPYIRSGENTLNIRIIVGGLGGILFSMRMFGRECSSWRESWSEKCTLK